MHSEDANAQADVLTGVGAAQVDRDAPTERGERTGLDTYGATNPTEFVSVAMACFFEGPVRRTWAGRRRRPADDRGQRGRPRRRAPRPAGGDGAPARPAHGVVQHLCYTSRMSAKSPRIHAVLEPRLFAVVKGLAREHGSSLSQEAHDLIREAVELHEDRALDGLAERRRASWSPKTALTAAEVRAQLKLR